DGYRGVPETPSIGTPNLLIVAAEMDEDLAYRFTKALFENIDVVRNIHPSANETTPETALDSPIPLHPGAIRYYEEIGLTVPDHRKVDGGGVRGDGEARADRARTGARASTSGLDARGPRGRSSLRRRPSGPPLPGRHHRRRRGARRGAPAGRRPVAHRVAALGGPGDRDRRLRVPGWRHAGRRAGDAAPRHRGPGRLRRPRNHGAAP